MVRSVLLAALTLSSAAKAQPVLVDDFETGSLRTSDMPPGRWGVVLKDETLQQVSISTAAAHRGDAGVAFFDSDFTGHGCALALYARVDSS
jgi:hypothetical protein